MATTSPDDIYSPDAGQQYALTQDLLAMADSIQQALIRSSPAGEVKAFTGGSAPSGYLLCNGQAVSRTTYAGLFAVIGTSYGVGNGSTTFNVPDLRGRALVGFDSGQAEFNALGKTGGEVRHTLTPQELPDHSHVWFGGTHGPVGQADGFMRSSTQSGQDGNFRTGAGIAASSVYGSTQITGSRAHNNLQPYAVVNYIIRT